MNSLQSGRAEEIRRALSDPGYHREHFYKQPLFPPQIETIKLIEEHIDKRSGKVITVRSSRQTMKNECSATVEERFLLRFQRCGGSIVKTAPTYRPQIVNSKRRLDKMLRLDPFVGRSGGYKEGYIKQLGLAEVNFLSGDANANVEGATASELLEIDEAHIIDKGKYEESFAPMTAFYSAPTVMWGVAACKEDLLYEQREFNKEHYPDLNLQFPAHIWCELLPAYARHYEERKKKLGDDHPVILTQYDLVDIDSTGGFFSRWQVLNLFSGKHKRTLVRTDEKFILVTIDIAGEAEDGEDEGLEKGDSRRDQTAALVWSVDWEKSQNDIPEIRLLDLYWWVGAPLSEGPSGLPSQKVRLLKLLREWEADFTVVDARGVGEETASYLVKNFGSVFPYKASQDSVSDDCYALLAYVNNDQVKLFQNDHSPDYEELTKQINHACREIRNHTKMAMVKPKGSSKKHIDMAKAMTYLRHGVEGYREYSIA